MTRLVLFVKSFTVCSTFHTACDIGDALIFLRRFFPQNRRLQPKFFVHHCLYAEVSLLSFSKREFHLAACAFEKTASFRTQLSTYSRRFITPVEHENSGEHEISDLSTDLSLSLSTVYNLGPRCPYCNKYVKAHLQLTYYNIVDTYVHVFLLYNRVTNIYLYK